MANIKVSTVLKDIENQPIKVADKDFTLREACMQALLIDDPSDESDFKLQRFNLAMNLRDAKDTLKLSAEDIVLIKKQVGKYSATLIMGQIYGILDA